MQFGNDDWKDDQLLEDDLKKYVARNLKRSEVLDFVKRDYPEYPWSPATLDRRLRHFNIYYIDYENTLESVQEAVREELNGPGKLLGYRAMNQKLRIQHGIKVPRHLVHTVLADEDPEGVEQRQLCKRNKPRKTPFVCDGPWNVASLDGHDKLCGYQNWTFPIGIYGCLDTFSRKILFLSVLYSNSNPNVIGRKYFEFLYEYKHMPRFIRLDKGSETGKMATMQVYLTNQLNNDLTDPNDSIIYGKSPTNKIERWWRDLHERLEKYFKQQLSALLHTNRYDPHSEMDRKMLAFIYIPVVERECNIFFNNWNSHRIREQRGLELPVGVPDHMFSFPSQYNSETDGFPLNREMLRELADASGVLERSIDFLDEETRGQFEEIFPHPEEIKSCDAMNAYIHLRNIILQ